MTQEHPITPPPELVEQWIQSTRSNDCIGAYPENYEYLVATQAARWGADAELEACISSVLNHPGFEQPELFVELLRESRRPKPPSLKEQALEALAVLAAECYGNTDKPELIRRALEQLDD